jgi:CHAT domain-containing protein
MKTAPDRSVLTYVCPTRWSLLVIAVSSSSCLMALKLPALAQIPPAFASNNATLTTQGHLLEENEPPQQIADRRQDNAPALREEADRLTQQGNIAYHSKLYLQAAAAYQQAAPLYHELRDERREARVLEELGLTYKILEQPEQAIESFQAASRLYRRLYKSDGYYHTDDYAVLPSIRCLEESGTILLKTQRFTEASETLLEAIDSLESDQFSALNARTIIRLRNGGNSFVGSLGLLVSPLVPLVSLVVGEISASSRNRISKVEEEVDASRTSLLDQHAKTYEKLQLALVAQNQIEKALEIAERSRSRASVELLASRSGSSLVSSGGISRSSRVRPLNIDQIKQIAATQKATLVEYSVIGNEVLYIWVVQPTGKVSFRPVALNPQAQNQIPQVEAIASLIDRADPNQPPESVISSLVKNIWGEPDSTVVLQQLHNFLIEPIADLLPTDPDQHVIFIPQSDIFRVPFAALLDSNGHYLIEKQTIRMIPSIQLLALTHEIRLDQEKHNLNISPVNPDEVLIVGNPTIPSGLRSALTPLPAAEQEAKTIAQMFQAEPLIGDRASEADVTKRMSHARIIHLATHGLLNNGAPNQAALQQLLNGELKEQLRLREIIGAIVLAPSEKEDGLLTTREITGLRLVNANLIVLSACDTGRGVIAADGVIGLSRALITAGAPSTIVSLWAVPDTPTANLMTEFYRQWQHYPDKAQALRQAMLKGMRSPNPAEQTPNPRDWAGFILIGES